MVQEGITPREYAQKLLERNRRALKELGFEPTAQLEVLTYSILHSLSELLVLILSTGNTKFYAQILTEYEQLLREQAIGRVVKVETAVPLTETEKKELRENLKRIVGKDFRLDLKVDSRITGGLIIRSEDRVIDQSLLRRLNELGESLSGG